MIAVSRLCFLARTAAAFSKDQGSGEGQLSLRRLLSSDEDLQHFHSFSPKLDGRRSHRGQRGLDQGRGWYVIEANQGDLIWDAQAGLLDGLHST